MIENVSAYAWQPMIPGNQIRAADFIIGKQIVEIKGNLRQCLLLSHY